MDFIYTGRVVLPPLLEVLCFKHPTLTLGLREPYPRGLHRAILALEKLLPSLKEIEFGGTWTRTRDQWRRGYGTGVEATIISQIWNPDGTRRS